MEYKILKNLKVLYAEDEQTVRKITIKMLEKYCDNIIEAKNGEEALKLYEKHSPDIIIADINMPKMTGIEAIQNIRKSDRKTCVIITTAHTDKDILLDATELYLAKYLVKPYKKEALLDAMVGCARELLGSDGNVVTFEEGCYYNVDAREVYFESELKHLTKKELLLLDLLLKNRNTVVTYKDIEREVWQGRPMAQASLRSLTKLLRKNVPSGLIANSSGVGYKLTLD
ncbi:MAG: response regulator [Campylobacterales bacterium]|nr:response regulator [Campylobacterales bacterium]